MKKLITICLVLVVLIGIMYAEYRYIMTNLHPYKGNSNIIYVEIFGQVDEYYDGLVPIEYTSEID
jgi:hypothetical protein